MNFVGYVVKNIKKDIMIEKIYLMAVQVVNKEILNLINVKLVVHYVVLVYCRVFYHVEFVGGKCKIKEHRGVCAGVVVTRTTSVILFIKCTIMSIEFK